MNNTQNYEELEAMEKYLNAIEQTLKVSRRGQKISTEEAFNERETFKLF